ncbi:putative septation protein SpoVG [Clostridia bacterium]|nr:putative septation protein SpoVG [Clostridia bacterium]
MTITAKIHRILPGGRKLKAIAEIVLDDVFVIHNVRVISGPRGLFAAMPSYIDRNGGYRDYCFPITREFGEAIDNAVAAAYEKACEELQYQLQ